MNEHSYTTNFGLLTLNHQEGDIFCWEAKIDVFEEQMPIYFISSTQKLSKNTIDFAEKIVLNIEIYLKKSLVFLNKTLTEQPEIYKISKEEQAFLKLDIEAFPVKKPKITFYENSDEWIIRYSEGDFDICDPYGIAVNFKGTKPVMVENIEDSEPI